MSRHPEFCRTLSPTDVDAADVRTLAAAVVHAPSRVRLQHLPPALVEVLAEVLESLAEGHAVTVTTHEASLTTQEAADVLGVSRPTLVRLLADGAIPYEQPGSHRRVKLHDVLAFQRDHRHPVAARVP